jgi:hypothetical protein
MKLSDLMQSAVKVAFVGPLFFFRIADMALVASKVVPARLRILANAGTAPNPDAIHEGFRMVSEKFAGSGEAFLAATNYLGQYAAAKPDGKTAGNMFAWLVRSPSIAEWMIRLARLNVWLTLWCVATGLNKILMWSNLFQRTTAPLQKRVVSNARRLTQNSRG